jgi:hypothetical protein
MQSLANAPRFARLASMDLNWNRIGAAGAARLAACPQLASLRALHLERSNIGTAGASVLRKRFGKAARL